VTTRTKSKLMQSASMALFIVAPLGVAHAQSVTIGTAVTITADAAKATDQSNTAAVDGTSTNSTTSLVVIGATTNGSLTLDANSSGAVARGNIASTSLLDADSAANATSAALGGLQSNTDDITATSTGARATLETQALTGSSASLLNQTETTTAGANSLTQSLMLSSTTLGLGTGSAATTTSPVNAFGSALVAGRQSNTAATEASSTNSSIALYTGVNNNSSAALTNSTDAATATGNSLTQSLMLTGTTAGSGVTVANATTTATALVAEGVAAVTSRQESTGSTTTASNSGITIMSAGTQTASSLELAGNRNTASATGSTASNGLTLSATTVAPGAVIGALQDSNAASNVLANNALTVVMSGDTLNASSATVAENSVQSQAVSGRTTNTLAVDATTVTLAAGGATLTGASLGATTGTVNAGFATLNQQSIANDATANVDPDFASGPIVQLLLGGNVQNGSVVANEANSVTASAQGAVTNNSTTLAVGGALTSGAASTAGIGNAAAVANLQSVASTSDVIATVDGGSSSIINTNLLAGVDASSVSTSSNLVQATAEATNATNRLSASGTTITVAAGATAVPSSSVGSSATVDAAFAVANSQSTGSGAVTARLGAALTPATVSTVVSSDVDASTIVSNSNQLDAFASANKSANSLTLAGTTVATDAGVVNLQQSGADTSASIIGNVLIETGADIRDSSASVNGNLARGSAIGNSSTNGLSVAATTLNGGGTDVQASGSAATQTANSDFSLANVQIVTAGTSPALSGSTATVTSMFGIDQAFDNELSGSRLSVSSNTQFAEALGSTATNRLSLSAIGAGGATDPTAALVSSQDGDTVVDAESTMTVFGNAAMEDSSLALNSNSNTALGVLNNAINSVNVAATTLNAATATRAMGSTTGVGLSTADYVLNSLQNAEGSVDSMATSTVINLEKGNGTSAYAADTTSDGTIGSAVSIANNSNTAEASANRVSNQLTVAATDIGATAALYNAQTNDADTTSVASSVVGFLMKTETTSSNNAVDGSRVTMNGNSTTALARGNSASNVLNYAVAANYSASTDPGVVTASTAVTATASVLNSQTNTADVSATTTGSTFTAVLNDSSTNAASLYAANNSSVTMANNAVQSVAYGNVASNALNMVSFGAGVPSSALSSNQSNTGAVEAITTGTTFGVTQYGAASGSALRVTGNSAVAQAMGNNSINTIGGGQ
jgi:hypothetical protein